jgi:hypothetical protein
MRRRTANDDEEVDGLLRVIATSGGNDSTHDYMSSGPTVSQLLERVEETKIDTIDTIVDTTFSGNLDKRGYRFGNLLTCCPTCCGCGPVWKKRFFVIRGGFLFRFTSNNRTARPKGTPIPLTDCIIGRVTIDEDELTNPELLLSLSTIRKEYILRANTKERRDEWIHRLQTAKHLSIKVSLGHAKQSNVDKRARLAGERMFNDNIRRERQAMDHETEMRNLSGMGGY